MEKDNEIISIGDVCIYSYYTKNKSISIVEVVKELSDEVVVVKFHQIIFDDSGNDLFEYLCNTGKTMNVSKKYLRKIDLINRQKAEIERLTADLKTTENIIKNNFLQKAGFDIDPLAEFKAEAIKEFAERLKRNIGVLKLPNEVVMKVHIDKAVKEMTGEAND